MDTWALSPEVKRPGLEADHSPPCSAEVKNGGAITSIYLYLTYRPVLCILDSESVVKQLRKKKL
jgi:hypothetical protein